MTNEETEMLILKNKLALENDVWKKIDIVKKIMELNKKKYLRIFAQGPSKSNFYK